MRFICAACGKTLDLEGEVSEVLPVLRQGIRRGCHGWRAGGRCAGQVLADDAGGLWGGPARYGGLSGQTKPKKGLSP